MKRLFSSRHTSTITFILSILAILVIAVSAPGMVQAVLGPGVSPGNVLHGNAIQVSDVKVPVANPAVQIGTLADTGIFGTVGIGTTSPVSPLHIYSTTSTQPETIDLDGAQPITAQWNDYSNTGGAFSGSGFLARYARGSGSSPSNVATGDRLGFNVFGGWAGTGFKHSAAIEAMVDSGTVSGTSLPTCMKFSTTPPGSVSRAERMRISADGTVGINMTNPYAGSKLHVYTENESVGARAVFGENSNGNYGYLGGSNSGMFGNSNSGNGVMGSSNAGPGVAGGSNTGPGVYGSTNGSGYAGYFDGRVKVNGPLTVAGAFAARWNSLYNPSGPTSYSLGINDCVLSVNASGGAADVYLPDAATVQGRMYTVKKTDATSNTVTIHCIPSQTIDGQITVSTATQWKYWTFISDGGNWLVIGGN